MVTFTCDLCNEALKKNKVANHRRCRGATFTCIDCNVTFTSASYAEHYKCVTESERYGGANYVSKENKGEAKQQKWIETVREAVKMLRNGREKQILMNVCKNENIPRKQKPFINFLKSSGACRDDVLCQKIWDSLQECLVWVKKAADKKESEEKMAREKKIDEAGDAEETEEA